MQQQQLGARPQSCFEWVKAARALQQKIKTTSKALLRISSDKQPCSVAQEMFFCTLEQSSISSLKIFESCLL